MSTDICFHPETLRPSGEAISRLAAAPGLRSRFSDAMRRRVEKHFSATAMADAYVSLYRSLGQSCSPCALDSTLSDYNPSLPTQR